MDHFPLGCGLAGTSIPTPATFSKSGPTCAPCRYLQMSIAFSPVKDALVIKLLVTSSLGSVGFVGGFPHWLRYWNKYP